MLALIGEIFGEEVANKTADTIEYEPHKDSKYDPFADKLGL